MISLGGNIGIGLTIRLNNQFSRQANQITGEFQNLYGNARKAMQQNLSAARQVGTAMTIAGALASRAFLRSTLQAAKFNYTLTGVQAVTDGSATAVDKLKRQLMLLNIESIYGSQQLGEAAYELTKSGFNIKQAAQAMKGISQFGAAGDMTQLGGKEGAAGIMAHTLNTFGLAANQAEMAADIMAYTANKSSVDLGDLAQSINYVGSEATLLKIPLETVSAMLGVLGNAGIRGTSAGVALANMISYLGTAATKFRTKKQGDMLYALGINPKSLLKANGELKDMVDIVDLFRVAMAKKSSPEQLGILRGLLNIRGARGFTKLFQDPEIGMQFREFQDSILSKAQGTSARIAKMKINTPFGQIEVLESTMENFRLMVGDILIPLLSKGTKLLIKMVNWATAFVKTPIGKATVWLAAGLALAVTAAGALIVVTTSLRLLTMASSVSFKNMGRSLVWAWTSAAAAATRYGLVARGVTTVGPNGDYMFMGKRGRPTWGKAGGAAAGAGGGGMLNATKIWVMNLVKGNGLFGRFLGIFKGISGMGLGLVSVFVMMIGFKNVIKGVIFGLGTLLQSLVFIWDYIKGVFHGDFSGTEARNNFARRQSIMAKTMGFEEPNINKITTKKEGRYDNTAGLQELFNKQQAAQKMKPVPVQVNVNVDGKKMSSALSKDELRWQEFLKAGQ